jgi:hypothetical protein
MDVTVTTRPQPSEPVQMPGGNNPLQKPPVFIECGSANSFELSPRFANLSIRSSRVSLRLLLSLSLFLVTFILLHIPHLPLQEHVSLDVETELKEAMSDTVQKTAEGEYSMSTASSTRHKHCTIFTHFDQNIMLLVFLCQ